MAFLGLFLVLLIALPGLTGFGGWALRRWSGNFDPALRWGLSGLAGLGLAGTLAYFAGFASTSLSLVLVWVLVTLGWFFLFKERPPLTLNKAALGLVVLASLTPLVGVLAPSTAMDWDSIAYHLAVPKIWISEGRVSSVSFIHHSNFPFAVDGLNLFALPMGGQAAAKAFQLAYFLVGLLAIYGLVREKFGARSAAWGAGAFATIPLVQWESGSAYIDVAHGLYAGLGAVLAIQGFRDRDRLMTGAVLLGLALGSKYTGLQSLFALGVVLVGLALVRKELPALIRPIGAALGVALLIGLPWYVKNATLVGNPVYPFFYEQFGGKNWNQTQADIYRNEQKTFGVPPALPLSMPHAILGLAYQPGRYVNPMQKLDVVEGHPIGAGGYPIGAAGFAICLAGLLAALRRPARSETDEGPILAWLAVSLLLWALLSQQSRYALSFAPPLCFLLGGSVSRPHWFGRVLMAAVVLQGVVTLYAAKTLLLGSDRLFAAFGRTAPDEYLQGSLPFFDAATIMNKDETLKKVALFDEVFGFYLDKPYFWASYGHTTELGYEGMRSPADFVAGLKKQGITHAYVNLRAADEDFRNGMVALAQGQALAVDPQRYIGDIQSRWKGLMLLAVQGGQMRPVQGTRAGLILAIP